MSELIDNRAHRVAALRDIIRHLHAGAAPEQVKERLREIVGQTDATEIMAMEQQLMAEGMPVEEVKSMCDLHSQVTRAQPKKSVCSTCGSSMRRSQPAWMN